MANAPAPLRQSDLTRYAKAMQAAGITDWRVEIVPGGKIILAVGPTDEASGPNPCDRLLK